MHTELFCACENCSFHEGGALTVRSVNNIFVYPSFPTVITDYTMAFRGRFSRDEIGEHSLAIETFFDDNKVNLRAEDSFFVEPHNDFPCTWVTRLLGFPEMEVTASGVLKFNLLIDGDAVANCMVLIAGFVD